MAKIAIAGSSIVGIDHAYDVSRIGRALAEAGHDIFYIVQDVDALRGLVGAVELAPMPAQSLTTDSSRSPPGSDDAVGFAEFLMRSGYGDLQILRSLASEWTALLQSVRPDRFVALANPVAWLVGPQIAPTLAIAHGRFLPPVNGQEMALLPQEASSATSSQTLLETANTVLAELNAVPLDDLSDLLRRCQRAHYGLEVLDPYLGSRQAPGLGVLGARPATFAPGGGQGFAAFLDAAYPNINSTLVAIAGLGDRHFDVFLYGATKAMKAFLLGLRHVTVHDSCADALERAANAVAIVHHGTVLPAEQAILNGRPHLVLPWTNDQRALLDGLRVLGVTWWKEPACSTAELAGTLLGVGDDNALALAANNVQRLIVAGGVADAEEKIVALIEGGRGSRRAPSKPSSAPVPVHEAAVNLEAALQQAPPLLLPQAPEGMSKIFCALPFQHLCVGTEGTARICCVASDLVSENGAPMSLYTKSFDEVWNSEYMREVRRKILADEPLSQCTVCYQNEAATSASYRTDTGLRPVDSRLVDIDAIRSEAIVNDYQAKKRPPFIKLELGNLCNLRCRMCWGAASSEIERDPVHSQWAGGITSMHAVWKGEYTSIGPDPKIGVKRTGVYDREGDGDDSMCWTNGAAHFDVPLSPDNRPYALSVDIHRLPHPRDCIISVNGKLAHTTRLKGELTSLTIDIDPGSGARDLTIDIESERSWNSERERWEGLPLRGVHLRRHAVADGSDKPVVLKPRLGTPGLWYKDDGLIFDELLGDGKDLRRLYVTGGEPLIEPRYAEILDYLIVKDAARNIDIELTTNGTVFNDEILNRLERFHSVLLTISVDGIGAVQEYIRFPARWATIEKNIRLMKRPNFAICAIPVVQAYNMLSVADICEFTEQTGIHLSLVNNLLEPGHLRTSVMPQNVHRVAADRMRRFLAKGCSEYLRGQAETLTQHFASFEAPLDREMLREFNLFTNDLDVSRGQSIRDSLPDLFGLIEEAGYRWSYETKHAGVVGPRRPARERTHAWI